jgi:hypothetical protein
MLIIRGHCSAARFVLMFVLAVGCHRELPPPLTDRACEAICESVRCFTPEFSDGDLSLCRDNCENKYEESSRQGSECQVAFQEGMDCVSDLNCDQFMDWYSATDNDPCPSVKTSVLNSCQGIFLEPEVMSP